MQRLLLATAAVVVLGGPALAGGPSTTPTPPNVSITVATHDVATGGGTAADHVKVGGLDVNIEVTGKATVGLATSQSLTTSMNGFTVP